MSKETKIDYLKRQFYFWCGKFKLEKAVLTKQDNRMDCLMAIDNWNDKENICLVYNEKRLRRAANYLIINYIFHELGHIINNLPYDSKKQIIESEYQAERFSCKMMKKYYPKQYKILLKCMKKKNTMVNLKRDNSLHYQAYKRIKDFRETEI